MALVTATGHAQTNVILHRFGSTPDDAVSPETSLTLVGKKLFGTTVGSGGRDVGTVFSMNLDGTGYDILHRFTGEDGAFPEAPMIAIGRTLYGTTEEGGIDDGNDGVLFSMDTDGSNFRLLHRFTGQRDDGACDCWEFARVGSRLFSTTLYGGHADAGNLFSINLDGSDYRVLHQADNYGSSALVAVGNTLYGTVGQGGKFGYGTIFAIQNSGSNYRVLHDFAGPPNDGGEPYWGLTVVGSKLFGTTGAPAVLYSINPDGSGYTVVRWFERGSFQGPLVYAGSRLYGYVYNAVFTINPDGSGYRILHTFTGGEDGAWPNGAPVLADSALYGTTFAGGIQVDGEDNGTVFMVPLRTGVNLRMKSKFLPGKADTALLKAFVIVPAGFEFSSVPVTIDIAGATASFVLDSHRRGTDGTSHVLFSSPAAGGRQWQVTVRLTGDFDSIWQYAGLTNATVTGQSVTIPVSLWLNSGSQVSLSTNASLTYRATAGKTGAAK